MACVFAGDTIPCAPMSFLVSCPYCGPRDVGEFGFGGEKLSRPPEPDRLSATEWAHYAYDRQNVDGLQTEWWYHRHGCSQWFQAERDTRTNRLERTWAPQPRQS
jgi:sarcosine oxidase, subunit delta